MSGATDRLDNDPYCSAVPKESVILKWVQENGFLRPLITVRLNYRGNEQGAVMLLDTGADTSILPRRYVDLLGIDRGDLKTAAAHGLGGRSEVLMGKKRIRVQAEIAGYFNVQIPIEFGINDSIPPILGRDALFGDFELRMNRREIELRRVS